MRPVIGEFIKNLSEVGDAGDAKYLASFRIKMFWEKQAGNRQSLKMHNEGIGTGKHLQYTEVEHDEGDYG